MMKKERGGVGDRHPLKTLSECKEKAAERTTEKTARKERRSGSGEDRFLTNPNNTTLRSWGVLGSDP